MSKSKTFFVNQQVCKLLAKHRKHSGLTQAIIADKLHKPQSYVSKIESGQRQLTVGDLVLICKAIGIRPSKFISSFD